MTVAEPAVGDGEDVRRTRATPVPARRRATYVYCLVVAAKRPRLTRVPAGLPGMGPVRLLDVGPQRYLAVADAPRSRYGEAAIRRGLSDLAWVSRAALAHEAVVEAFIDETAVLPMKLFTLFSSDERAVAHLRAERRRIDALVARLARHLEWGVRLKLSPTPVVGANRRRATARTRPAADRAGIAYLNEKRARRDQARERARHARTIADSLFDKLSERARAAKRRSSGGVQPPQGVLLLDAAFLVPRADSRAFHALVRREQRDVARRGYDLTITGPWPPYSFVQESR